MRIGNWIWLLVGSLFWCSEGFSVPPLPHPTVGGKLPTYLFQSPGWEPSQRLRLHHSESEVVTEPPVNSANTTALNSSQLYVFDLDKVLSVVLSQTALVGASAVLAFICGTPNHGFGAGFRLDEAAWIQGTLLTLPLVTLNVVLTLIEDDYPSIKDVGRATERSVLALMGSSFNLGLGLAVATALGITAGLGEEVLFRGVMQSELGHRYGDMPALVAVSIVFGLIHNMTAMYGVLTLMASLYFGYIYLQTGNLAVPIITHGVYDVVAVMYAYWSLAQLTDEEVVTLSQWQGPASRTKK